MWGLCLIDPAKYSTVNEANKGICDGNTCNSTLTCIPIAGKPYCGFLAKGPYFNNPHKEKKVLPFFKINDTTISYPTNRLMPVSLRQYRHPVQNHTRMGLLLRPELQSHQ